MKTLTLYELAHEVFSPYDHPCVNSYDVAGWIEKALARVGVPVIDGAVRVVEKPAPRRKTKRKTKP